MLLNSRLRKQLRILALECPRFQRLTTWNRTEELKSLHGEWRHEHQDTSRWTLGEVMAERVVHIKGGRGIGIRVLAHLGPEERTDRAEGKEENWASRGFFKFNSKSETRLNMISQSPPKLYPNRLLQICLHMKNKRKMLFAMCVLNRWDIEGYFRVGWWSWHINTRSKWNLILVSIALLFINITAKCNQRTLHGLENI